MSSYKIPRISEVSAADEARERKYHLYIGESGRTWLVANTQDAGDHIYVTAHADPNIVGDGFGGGTLPLKLVDGRTFNLKGGWHSNPNGLLQDTGVDVMKNHITFVVLAKSLDMREQVLSDVVYKDDKPQVGLFERWKELAKEHPEANYYFYESAGGAGWGPIKDKHRA